MDVTGSIHDLVLRALDEDIGSGDVTASALLNERETGSARAIAKSPLVVAGLDVFKDVFVTLDGAAEIHTSHQDGDKLEEGEEIASVTGVFRSLLMAERVALNFLQRMSGIATLTRAFVKEVAGTEVHILDTRKTTPGMRILEKYAVRVGGGLNHRFGLYGGAMIKENHIAAVGGIAVAVEKVKRSIPPTLKVELEVKNILEVKEALNAKVDIIMLDNMTSGDMRDAVAMIAGKALVEASGNVTLSNVREIARTGVDFISIGALTHSAPAADISLLVDLLRSQ